MSYGLADKIAAIVTGTPGTGRERSAPAIDPALYRRDDVRRILAVCDIGARYKVLKDAGVTQRQIATLTGQSQSEVKRDPQGSTGAGLQRTRAYRRGSGHPSRADGAGQRGGYGQCRQRDRAYSEVEGGLGSEVEVEEEEEEEEEMRRRALLAATSCAAPGRVMTNLGELAELALPRAGDELLPSRLGMAHVQDVEAVTERLRTVARQHGGQAEVFGAAARCYTRWKRVPAPDAVKV